MRTPNYDINIQKKSIHQHNVLVVHLTQNAYNFSIIQIFKIVLGERKRIRNWKLFFFFFSNILIWPNLNTQLYRIISTHKYIEFNCSTKRKLYEKYTHTKLVTSKHFTRKEATLYQSIHNMKRVGHTNNNISSIYTYLWKFDNIFESHIGKIVQ